MSAENNKVIRLKQVAKELNVGIHTIVEYLGKKGKKIDENPNTKIDSDMYDLLSKVFQGEKKLKEASKITKKTTKPVEIVLDATEVVKKEKEERKEEEVPTNEIVIRDVTLGKENKKEKVADKKEKVVEKIVEQKVEEKVEEKKQEIKIEEKTQQEQEQKEEETTTVGGLNILGKIDLGSLNQKTKPTKKKKEKKKEKKEEKPQKPVSTDKKQEKKEEKKQEAKQEPKTEVKVEKKEKVAPAPEFISTSYVKLSGPVLTGEKVDLSQFQKPKKQQPVASSSKGKIENKEKQDKEKDKKKRKRIKPAPAQAQQSANPAQPAPKKENKKHKPAKRG